MIEMVILNAAAGDFTAEFDTDDTEASGQLAEMVEDMLHKGYALFLEDGKETFRVMGYDAGSHEFEVRLTEQRKGTVKIRVATDAPASAPAAKKTSRRTPPLVSPGSGKPFPKQRVTSVAPMAGG